MNKNLEQLNLKSKLPDVGTTIFSVISALANRHNAINLGQGFPDFSCDPELVQSISRAMTDGYNQYAPMQGVEPLLKAIANKINNLYQRNYNPETEITVTAGATQALLTAILATVRSGDEVIVIEPSYDSYVPAIILAGGVPVFVTMGFNEAGFSIPWEKVKSSITAKTRLIILNSPHNPTGFVLSPSDINSLSDVIKDTRILIISDEVYEHIVYDNRSHESICRYQQLAERAFVISSFGKTYHVTGWKLGYVVAPEYLMREFRKVHQFNVFSVNTPMQIGMANFMKDSRTHLNLSNFYERKRNYFKAGVSTSRFRFLPCEGTYFQCADYSEISDSPDLEFAKWLTTKIGVAAIPLSAFYRTPDLSEQKLSVVRFCFAKKEQTLEQGFERLNNI